MHHLSILDITNYTRFKKKFHFDKFRQKTEYTEQQF